MTLSVTGSSISSFTLNAGNFINPYSTTTVTGISTYLLDSSGNSLGSYTTTTLSNLTPGLISTATITP